MRPELNILDDQVVEVPTLSKEEQLEALLLRDPSKETVWGDSIRIPMSYGATVTRPEVMALINGEWGA